MVFSYYIYIDLSILQNIILLSVGSYFLEFFLSEISPEKPYFRTFQNDTEILWKSELTTSNILGDTTLWCREKKAFFSWSGPTGHGAFDWY